jgi:hypothetical protein
VSIPFKDNAEMEAGGTAAFLRLLPGAHDRERRGAILQVNGRGSPVEFTYNRVDLPASALWRPDQLQREVAKTLAASLFEATRRTPLVIICLAAEIPPALFGEDLDVKIPVCRVAPEPDLEPAPSGGEDVLTGGRSLHLFWRPHLPAPQSPPRRLVATLSGRGLLLEPFDRMLEGLEEAFRADASADEVR